MNKAEKFIGGSPNSELPLPSQRYINYNKHQLSEQPKQPSSARNNVVSMDILNQIKQLAA